MKTGQEFKEIHDSYVIFITASDVIGAGHSLYHVNRMIEETGTYFGDSSHIIYVNGSYKDDNDPVGKLMHDFRCLNSDDMFYQVLAKQVKYFKETEGGLEIMCQVFEDLAEKRVLDEKVNLIKNLMETMKWTAEQAMEAMKISETDKKLLASRLYMNYEKAEGSYAKGDDIISNSSHSQHRQLTDLQKIPCQVPRDSSKNAICHIPVIQQAQQTSQNTKSAAQNIQHKETSSARK